MLKKVKIEDNIIVQELDNSTIILNLDTEYYFGLDDVGQRFWQLLSEHQDTEIAFNIILNEFDVDPKILEVDISKLIEDLLEAKLISIV